MAELEFPIYLLKYVKAENIDLGNYETEGVGLILPNGAIFINRNDSLEEQVKSVLHEVTHYHPKFMEYTQLLVASGKLMRDEGTESEIEAAAREVYRTRPRIVEYIKGKIEEASTHYLNLRK